MDLQQVGMYKLTPTALTLAPDLPYEKWETIFTQLRQLQKALPWFIGDLLHYGEMHYGETYAQAVEETGHSVQTLTNYKSVCGRVPPEVRTPDLTFSHHALVAALPVDEQKVWLAKAVTESMSTQELREELREEVEAIYEPEPEHMETLYLSYNELGVLWAFMTKHKSDLSVAELDVLEIIEDAWNAA